MTYNKTRRRHFSPKQRVAFLAKHDSICYWCGGRIEHDQPWEIEHRIARELLPDATADDDENLAPIHALPKLCHKVKTGLDRKAIAKSNRIIRRNGPKENRRKTKPIPQPKNFKWASRPFPKKER